MGDLVVEGLTVEYPSSDYVVRPLDNLDLHAADGSLVLLLGPSGCGKTTMLSALGAMLTPTAGRIRHGDTDITKLQGAALTRYRRLGVGIVFQAFNLVPSLDAVENVMTPMRAAGRSRREARERAVTLLSDVGLGDRLGHRPGDLSGGQQQRVAIARALANDPPLLLADEPTAHLDYVQVDGVLRIMRQLARPGRVVVVSTHDDRMLPLADQVVELGPKAVASDGAPEHVTLDAGEVLFEQGSFGERIYVIDSGEIQIYRPRADGTEENLNVLRAGDYFGEMGPTFRLPRSASARAVTPATLTGYTVQDFRNRLHTARAGSEAGDEQV
jgi:putative ABC transport system ATP-binding protein